MVNDRHSVPCKKKVGTEVVVSALYDSYDFWWHRISDDSKKHREIWTSECRLMSTVSRNRRFFPCDLRNKREKHVNLLYLQNPRNDNIGHFTLIKNPNSWAHNWTNIMEKNTFATGILYYNEYFRFLSNCKKQ